MTTHFKKRKQQTHKFSDSLKIIPLGGQEEVGRNMTVFELGTDIIILDMGSQFPEEYMLGIDYIIPNISYLKGKEKNIRGVIFSHGHLDHIGASPILLEQLGNPLIVGRPLTLALVKNRQEDYKKGTAGRLKTMTVNNVNQVIRLGGFIVKFFPVDHSIMDAVGVILETRHGTVVHPGDWTYEKNPINHTPVTYNPLAKIKRPSILMLESLGATQTKDRVPEHIMYQNTEKLISEAPGRIIIATFASQIERIKLIMQFAEKYNRKVALDGYSMKVNMEIAQQFGYIKMKKGAIVPIDKINSYPDRRVVILCTGAQGENRAALSRIVNDEHRFVKIRKDDTVIFSSSVIPGNENTIQRLKDNLYRLTENVVHSEIMDIHSSGHSTASDMVEVVMDQIKPDYYLPVYANHYFLKEAKKLMAKNGFPEKNIFVLDNGSILEFKFGKPKLSGTKVPTDYVYVDGLGVGDVSHIILRDRQALAADGMVVIIAKISDRTGEIMDEPEIIAKGFINETLQHDQQLIQNAKAKVKQLLKEKDAKPKSEGFLRDKVSNSLGQYFFSKTKRRPMIIPVLINV
jgi:ribonuclease J